MKVLAAAALTLAIAASAVPAARAAEGDAADRCHQAIARGQAADKRGRIAQVGRCLKSVAYDNCIETDSHTAIHENELRHHVSAPESESRFGKSLAKFARNVAACRVDEGEAPGALASLCGGTATDAAGLTLCLEGLAKCLACRTANSALGQNEDCTAFSGFADCDGVL